MSYISNLRGRVNAAPQFETVGHHDGEDMAAEAGATLHLLSESMQVLGSRFSSHLFEKQPHRYREVCFLGDSKSC